MKLTVTHFLNARPSEKSRTALFLPLRLHQRLSKVEAVNGIPQVGHEGHTTCCFLPSKKADLPLAGLHDQKRRALFGGPAILQPIRTILKPFKNSN